MKKMAVACLVVAILSFLVAVLKSGVNVNELRPNDWLKVANTMAFLSIAIGIIATLKKK